eukprot:m.110786 g.110786  ORF g.110786 m.110786 type:complete len:426 (+) comp37413_c0_seq18:283-1560(+)
MAGRQRNNFSGNFYTSSSAVPLGRNTAFNSENPFSPDPTCPTSGWECPLGCDWYADRQDGPSQRLGYAHFPPEPKWNAARFVERRVGEKTVAQIKKSGTTLFGSPDLLWWGSRYGNAELCRFMLGLDERVHQLGRMAGVSGLHMASLWNHDDIIRLYVEKQQNVDVRDDYGLTAAFWATVVGNRNCMTELSQAGCNIGKTTEWQLSSDIVADINTGIARSRNWFDVSCFETNLLLLKGFQQEGMTNDQEVQFLKDLMLWILSGERDSTDLKLYATLLNHNADPFRLIYVTSAFHRAARFGHRDVLQLFLSWRGVNVDIADRLGWTALHYAAFCDHEDCARLLTDKLADPTVDTVEGNPITVAHVYERYKIISHLRDYQPTFDMVRRKAGLAMQGNDHQQPACKKLSFVAENSPNVFQGETVNIYY